MSRKVCHISTVHPVLDDRILFKECNSLKESGFDVSYVVANPDSFVYPGIQIISLPVFNGRFNRLIRGSMAAYRLAKQTRAELFHFHDPELMLMAVFLRLSGKKVVYDVHENITQQVRYKPWIKPTWFRWLLSRLVHLTEKFCCLFFQGIVAATDDIARKFPSSKTSVIRNFPLFNWTEDIHNEPHSKDVPTLIYAGGLTQIRGIREIIDSLSLMSFPIRLKLIGKFDDEAYEQECKASPGWQYVEYKGFMSLKDVYSEVATSDIGVAMLYPIRNYLTSLPVKAFEYMAFGLPMIVSDFPFWKEMFKGCAVFADPMKPESIAAEISKLVENEELRMRLGEMGLKRVREELNWETESKRLIDLYKKILHES
jgi:glycosyltransferase involved in cell wall biosynthesis